MRFLAFITVMALAVFVGWASDSHAQSLTLTLERLSLDNVDDPAGLWQHEGGRVHCANGTHIAN